jgi:hypothetical protein
LHTHNTRQAPRVHCSVLAVPHRHTLCVHLAHARARERAHAASRRWCAPCRCPPPPPRDAALPCAGVGVLLPRCRWQRRRLRQRRRQRRWQRRLRHRCRGRRPNPQLVQAAGAPGFFPGSPGAARACRRPAGAQGRRRHARQPRRSGHAGQPGAGWRRAWAQGRPRAAWLARAERAAGAAGSIRQRRPRVTRSPRCACACVCVCVRVCVRVRVWWHSSSTTNPRTRTALT